MTYSRIMEAKWGTCMKCCDGYIMVDGRYSQRRSCRQHCYDPKTNRCVDCGDKSGQDAPNRNCYHTNVPTCCGIPQNKCCIIS